MAGAPVKKKSHKFGGAGRGNKHKNKFSSIDERWGERPQEAGLGGQRGMDLDHQSKKNTKRGVGGGYALFAGARLQFAVNEVPLPD